MTFLFKNYSEYYIWYRVQGCFPTKQAFLRVDFLWYDLSAFQWTPSRQSVALNVLIFGGCHLYCMFLKPHCKTAELKVQRTLNVGVEYKEIG